MDKSEAMRIQKLAAICANPVLWAKAFVLTIDNKSKKIQPWTARWYQAQMLMAEEQKRVARCGRRTGGFLPEPDKLLECPVKFRGESAAKLHKVARTETGHRRLMTKSLNRRFSHMNFETKHEVVKGVFSTQVVFDSYGTDTMDEAHELALFNDLGNPVINLGSIKFDGNFKVDADVRVVPAEDTDIVGTACDKVSLIVNSKRLELAKGFVAEYRVDATDIPDAEIGKILSTPKLVAEAKCVLFEQRVKEAIKTATDALKKERTRFESTVVPTLTV